MVDIKLFWIPRVLVCYQLRCILFFMNEFSSIKLFFFLQTLILLNNIFMFAEGRMFLLVWAYAWTLHNKNSGELMSVPVCADYCDAWFEACKDDLTCVENYVEMGFHNLSIDYTSSCPQNSTCRTYRVVYRDGRGLCNKIWGSEYAYSTDRDNCTVMAFKLTTAWPIPTLSLRSYEAAVCLTLSRSGIQFWARDWHYWYT